MTNNNNTTTANNNNSNIKVVVEIVLFDLSVCMTHRFLSESSNVTCGKVLSGKLGCVSLLQFSAKKMIHDARFNEFFLGEKKMPEQ